MALFLFISFFICFYFILFYFFTLLYLAFIQLFILTAYSYTLLEFSRLKYILISLFSFKNNVFFSSFLLVMSPTLPVRSHQQTAEERTPCFQPTSDFPADGEISAHPSRTFSLPPFCHFSAAIVLAAAIFLFFSPLQTR